MGLSSKQVSSDGLVWSQTLLKAQKLELPKPPVGRRQQLQNLPAAEQLRCPRCDSTNTKFCYYNNYNKSQPRHFCKTCKRHWTKGGTLRNVPVGGGRKNRRLKSSKPTAKTTTTTAGKSAVPSTNGNIIDRVNPQMVIQTHRHQQKTTSEIMSRPLISSPSASVFISGNDQFSLLLGSNFHQNQANLHFPYSSSNFDTNPSSISTSFQPPNAYNFSRGETMEDSIATSIMSNTSCALMPQLWQIPNTTNWNWDDLDTFGPTDLNIPWDDSELKP